MRKRLTAYCKFRGLAFDEDVFQLSVLNMLERERQQGGMKDPTQSGIDNYLFRAFTTNMARERLYPRVARTTFIGDDLQRYDRPEVEESGLYAAVAGKFGVENTDRLADGAPMDDDIRAEMEDYIRRYVNGDDD